MDDASQVAAGNDQPGTRTAARGEVEVDETWIGGTQAGLRGSRQLKGRKAALVLVVVEKRGCVTSLERSAPPRICREILGQRRGARRLEGILRVVAATVS